VGRVPEHRAPLPTLRTGAAALRGAGPAGAPRGSAAVPAGRPCAAEENKEPKTGGFRCRERLFRINIRISMEIKIIFSFVSCTCNSEINLLRYLVVDGQICLGFPREF